MTSRVKVTRGAIAGVPPLFRFFALPVTLTNPGATAIPGPISLVADGLPRTGSPCIAGAPPEPAAPPVLALLGAVAVWKRRRLAALRIRR